MLGRAATSVRRRPVNRSVFYTASAASRVKSDWSNRDSFGFRGSACATSVMRPTAYAAARTSRSPGAIPRGATRVTRVRYVRASTPSPAAEGVGAKAPLLALVLVDDLLAPRQPTFAHLLRRVGERLDLPVVRNPKRLDGAVGGLEHPAGEHGHGRT